MQDSHQSETVCARLLLRLIKVCVLFLCLTSPTRPNTQKCAFLICSCVKLTAVFCVLFLQSDYHFEYTECDVLGSRWRVAVPNKADICTGLPDPVAGTRCSRFFSALIPPPLSPGGCGILRLLKIHRAEKRKKKQVFVQSQVKNPNISNPDTDRSSNKNRRFLPKIV